jgi:hypothetical protein
MACEGHRDLVQHGFAQDFGAAQVAACLLCLSRSQVARAGLTMFRLALGGQAKPLFRSLMCLLLWHEVARYWQLIALLLPVRRQFLVRKALQYRGFGRFRKGMASSTSTSNVRASSAKNG